MSDGAINVLWVCFFGTLIGLGGLFGFLRIMLWFTKKFLEELE